MSEQKYSVLLKTLVKELELTTENPASDYEEKLITSMAVSRPGLQFAGFYEYFDPRRIIIYGKQENKYLERLDPISRFRAIEELMQHNPPAIVVCHRVMPSPELVNLAKTHNINVFSTDLDTSEFMANLISSLHIHLAPRKTVHAVLVDVYGEGLLIMGDSGIGKSETALELVKRGHRLIADDAVEIKRILGDKLIGTAPEMIRHFMEFRGIGVVNARAIYGVGAVKSSQTIHMVVQLENWDPHKQYERLGVESPTTEILGVNLPSITVPVRPGRNLAVILELAAMNNRQKKMGYNAALDLVSRHDSEIDGNSEFY